MRSMLKGLWREQSGDDLEEYALLLAMIALGVVVALSSFGAGVSKSYTSAGQALPSGFLGGFSDAIGMQEVP